MHTAYAYEWLNDVFYIARAGILIMYLAITVITYHCFNWRVSSNLKEKGNNNK